MEKLKTIRKSRGLSRASLAKKVGITVSHYGNVETARTGASVETLSAICQALEIKVEDIWESNDPLSLMLPSREKGIIIEKTRFVLPESPESYKYIVNLVSNNDCANIDPEFQTLIENWNKLPCNVKIKILELSRKYINN